MWPLSLSLTYLFPSRLRFTSFKSLFVGHSFIILYQTYNTNHTLYSGGVLTRKKHDRIFWGVKTILHLDLSDGYISSVWFSSVQWLSHVQLFATPWITACQASLSITNFWSSFRLTCIELVMPCSHLILCRPLLLLPPIPPSIRVFSSESALRMR